MNESELILLAQPPQLEGVRWSDEMKDFVRQTYVLWLDGACHYPDLTIDCTA
jgi:hypothetical protein